MKTILKPIEDAVQSMRKIRDEISDEIKDMTFNEERYFLDKLLEKKSANTVSVKDRIEKPSIH